MGASLTVEIERVTSSIPAIRDLIAGIDAELKANYLPEQLHYFSLDAMLQSHMRFFMVRLDGVPAGCGGIALFPDFAEVKRMYVHPHLRGQGVADAIMVRLEQEVIASGPKLLRLETGIRQYAAIGFYRRCGFEPCQAFAPYTSMAPLEIAASLFFEKRVGA